MVDIFEIGSQIFGGSEEEGGSDSGSDTPWSIAIAFEGADAKIKNTDIIEMKVMEDIYSMDMIGVLQMVDTIGIMESGPLTGNEKVYVSIGNADTIDIELDIIKFRNAEMIESANAGSQGTITLDLAGTLYKKLTQTKYSTSWKDTKISDMITDINKKWLGIENWNEFEETDESMDFTMPLMTPAEGIKWLSKRASGSDSGQPGFLFYTTPDGAHFQTIERLLQNTSTDPNNYVFNCENKFYVNKILHWKSVGIDSNSLKTLSGGTTYGFDPDRKKFLKSDETYTDNVNDTTLLGKNALHPDVSNSESNYTMSGERDETRLKNVQKDKWMKQYNLQQGVEFTVRGTTHRTAGMMIEVEWQSINNDDMYNKNLQGKYLIKSITHVFRSGSDPTYIQKIMALKNAYDDADSTSLLSSTKQNVAGVVASALGLG